MSDNDENLVLDSGHNEEEIEEEEIPVNEEAIYSKMTEEDDVEDEKSLPTPATTTPTSPIQNNRRLDSEAPVSPAFAALRQRFEGN